MACREGDVSAVRQGLALGHDPDGHDDQTGTRPLHATADGGSVPVARLLLSAGADVNARGGYGGLERPLEAAAGQGHLQLIRFLIRSGAAINYEGRCPVMLAAVEAGHDKVVAELLATGAKMDEQALPAAVKRGDRKLIDLLLKAGANLHWSSPKTGRTLAHHAAQLHAGPQILRYLVDRGLGIAGKTTSGETPFHLVHHEDTALFLLEKGTEINAQTTRGITPLMTCADRGFPRACRRLLALGADHRARSANKRTALQGALFALTSAEHFHKPPVFDYTERIKQLREIVSHLRSAVREKGKIAAQPPKPATARKQVSASKPKALKQRKTELSPYILNLSTASRSGARDFINSIHGPPYWAVMAIAAEFEEMVKAGASIWPTAGWQRNVAIVGSTRKDAAFISPVVLKLNQSPWSIVLGSLGSDGYAELVEKWAQAMSASLKSRAITFLSAKTAGVMGASIYDTGDCTEQSAWATDGLQSFKSRLRRRPRLAWDGEEGYADAFFREHGIYWPACYPVEQGTNAFALAVQPASAETVLRADILEPGRL